MTSTPPTEPRPETPLAALGRTLAELDQTKETLTKAMGAINTERQTRFRWRFTMAVLIPMTVFILVLCGFILQAVREARNVGNTLNDCLVATGDCYERLARDGLLGSNRQIDFNACYLRYEISARTDEAKTACIKEADDNFFKKVREAEGK